MKVAMQLYGVYLLENTLLQIADLTSADMALAGLKPFDPATGNTPHTGAAVAASY